METITLLDRFTYQDGGTGGMFTPWVHFPAEYRQAEYWVDTKLHNGGTVTLDLESSIDTTSTQQVDTQGLSAKAQTVSLITSKLGPLVRLKLSNATVAGAVLSVWLVPKQD